MATTRRNDDWPTEPLDALAAMLEVERSMIEATQKMMELNRALPNMNPKEPVQSCALSLNSSQ